MNTKALKSIKSWLLIFSETSEDTTKGNLKFFSAITLEPLTLGSIESVGGKKKPKSAMGVFLSEVSDYRNATAN